jgi:hypothetical protein
MSCGFNLHNDSISRANQGMTQTFSTQYKSIWLYSAYLGRVKVKVGITDNPNTFNMECKGVGSATDVVVREVDTVISRIDLQARSSLTQLAGKPPAVINIRENKECFFKIQKMEAQKAIMENDNNKLTLRQTALDKFTLAHPKLSKYLERRHSNIQYDPEVLRALYVKNSVVDIHFNTTLYLEFLQEKLGRSSINNGKLLISLFNVPKLDNAYFSGEYMIYGNGDKMFYPLTAIDVAGHELGHGLVQATAGLEYQGHSGALNESFSDVLGTSFEFWLYKKFNTDEDKSNDIMGSADWLIGEDIGKTIKYLRNMRDPTKAEHPQPKMFQGRYWFDPNGEPDYGGVHVNSGVSNYCFYLLSEKVGIDVSLPIFYNCLLKLNRNSDFLHFRNILIECSPEAVKLQTAECLNLVGLGENAVSRWSKSPSNHRNPTQSPSPSQPGPSQGIRYPNPHIPFIRGQCCPHCLCLQGSRRFTQEPRPKKLSKKRKKYSSDNESESESESESE